jgi:hypothetical protein
MMDVINEYAEKDFNERLEDASARLGKILDDTINSVLRDFDLRYTLTRPPAARDAKHTEFLLREAREAIAQLEGPIKDHLENCVAFERSGGQVEVL